MMWIAVMAFQAFCVGAGLGVLGCVAYLVITEDK